MRKHEFYKSDDKKAPVRRKSSLKKGRSKPGVKFSKVNRIQSEDGKEAVDDSCIDFEVSSDSSMSVDALPPKFIVWKDRPKSRKVSKIRMVSTIHRTTKVDPPTNDTTGTGTPPVNDGGTQDAAVDEQARSEQANQAQATHLPVLARRRSRPPWPYGSGMPGFGAYRGSSWHDSGSEDHEGSTEHDDLMHPAPTSDAQATPILRASSSKRCRKSQRVDPTQSEVEGEDEPPELFKDGESSDNDSEHQTDGKMSSDPKSSESNWHFIMCPDLRSSDSNLTDSNQTRTKRILSKVLR